MHFFSILVRSQILQIAKFFCFFQMVFESPCFLSAQNLNPKHGLPQDWQSLRSTHYMNHNFLFYFLNLYFCLYKSWPFAFSSLYFFLLLNSQPSPLGLCFQFPVISLYSHIVHYQHSLIQFYFPLHVFLNIGPIPISSDNRVLCLSMSYFRVQISDPFRALQNRILFISFARVKFLLID